MLGFLLSDRATHYHGIDAAPETCEGVQRMFDDLSTLTPQRRKSAQITCAPFEDVSLDQEAYDVAITSPPYYDTEKYPGEQSSWRVYASFDDWVSGFYVPLLTNVAKALKPHGVFALQVGSQSYPLRERAVELAPRCGLVHAETRHTDMINNRMGTEPDAGEVVVILRKP
jgi:tRNA1(Val) A37 N6-methylase TrmN6